MAEEKKKSASYGEDSISALKGEQRIREKPASVLGSDGLEGCEHTFIEILANAVDEAREGHGQDSVAMIAIDTPDSFDVVKASFAKFR